MIATGQSKLYVFLSPDKNMAYLDAGMKNAWKTIDQVHKLDPVTIAVLDTDFAIPPTGNNETDKIITREFDIGNIHVQDLVPGVGSARHGVAVTSVIVAANNARPDHAQSFSGVVTSVDKLDYNLIFYALGDNSGKPEHSSLVTAFQLINNLEALLRHKEQIDVVNISLAIGCHRSWEFDLCDLNDEWVKDLIALMKQMPEITFVVAAGNAVTNIDNRTVIPASLSTLDNVITVGGVSRDATTTRPTKNFQWWSGEIGTEGSNYGKGVTLGAPAEVWAVNSGPPGQYALHKGTSFAAPMVTGTVALMKALKPAATPAEIKKILVQTGDINHGVCKNPAERDCAKLPILDAGAALVEEVDGGKIVDIKARISSATLTLIETWPGNTAIAISAENTGSHGAFFIMKGYANYGGTPSKLHMDKSETILLLPKDSSSFRLDFPVKMDGELKVNVGIYSSHDPTIALDWHKLTIESVAAPTTATASTATPAPTATPSPRPTPTRTTVPSPQPTSAPIAVPNLRTMPAPDGSTNGPARACAHTTRYMDDPRGRESTDQLLYLRARKPSLQRDDIGSHRHGIETECGGGAGGLGPLPTDLYDTVPGRPDDRAGDRTDDPTVL